MTTDTITPLAPEQGTSLTVVSDTLTELQKVEAGLADLAKRFNGVVYDVQTTKGMDQAKADRLEVREVRYSVQRATKSAKDWLNDQKKVIDQKAEYVTGEIQKIETPIDDQIKAEEKRRSDEKAAREQAERERIATIAQKLADIRAQAAVMPGTPSVEIERTIALLVINAPTEAEFGDMYAAALRAHDETLLRLKNHNIAAMEHEAQQRALAEAAAELVRQQEAQRMAAAAAAAAARAEADRLAEERREFEAQQAAARAEAKRLDDERRAAEQKAAAEQQAVFEAERAAFRQQQADAAAELARQRAEIEAKAQAERDRVAAAEKAARDAEAAAAAEVARLAAIEAQRIKDAQDAEDARRRALQLEAARIASEQAAAQAAALDRVQRAGPVMLAALQAARNSLVAFKFQPGDCNSWEDHDEQNLAEVDAAINLATGG